jgi:hypothetical protein
MDKHQPHQHKGAGDKGQKKILVTPVKPGNKARFAEQEANYNHDLQEILQSLDVERFGQFLQTQQRALPEEMLSDSTRLETMMHQLILSMPELATMHGASREWLDGNTVLRSVRSLLEAAQVSPEQKLQEFDEQAEEAAQKTKRSIIFLNVPPKSTEDN